jgi:hypothetical protein
VLEILPEHGSEAGDIYLNMDQGWIYRTTEHGPEDGAIYLDMDLKLEIST